MSREVHNVSREVHNVSREVTKVVTGHVKDDPLFTQQSSVSSIWARAQRHS